MAKKNKNDYEDLERDLNELQQKLFEELQQRIGSVGNVSSDDPTEMMDLATDSEVDFMAAVSAEAGSDTVREIQEALRKVKEGSYGVCEDCGTDIPKRRLEARPFATRCISCKEEQERRMYQFAPRSYVHGHVPSAAGLEESEAGEEAEFDADLGDVMREMEDLEANELF